MTPLKTIRTIKELRQIEVAFETGIHPSQLSRIEKGWSTPTRKEIKKLAEFYGVTEEELSSSS